jgi:glycosyltransferase involved in cell wall biosynthesis
MSDAARHRPAITVGVPVYNGEAHLAGTLDVILGQTFADLEVLIFDNASTDATAKIAADYVARDSRVRYVRQPSNKGPMGNFLDAVEAADSPYFLWRAADDRSDLNFLEVLHGLLERHPDKTLAVGAVVAVLDGAEVSRHAMPRLKGDGGPADRRTLLFGAHQCWIYGLYRTPAIAQVMRRVIPRYGDNPWSWDNMVLLPFLLDAAVVGTDETRFIQALRPRERRPRGVPRPAVDLDDLLARRARFVALGRAFVDERFPPGPGRALGHALLWRYVHRSGFNAVKLARRRVGRRLGLRR